MKEHLGVKDLDHNAGFVAWVGRTSSGDAHIVQILENAGGVFHVRTTQPQSLMHLETSSNIYGYVEFCLGRGICANEWDTLGLPRIRSIRL